MFSLDLSPTFEAPVRLELQAASGGKRQVVEFTGIFPRMTDDDLRAFGKQVDAEGLSDRQVSARLLRGWGDDVRDAHGNALAFNEANLAAVLNVVGCGAAVVQAFRQAQPKAALGN